MVTSTKANPTSKSAPSRREMLNYTFGASLGLMLAGSCGGLVWFMQQARFVGGSESGLFQLDIDDLPPPDGAPLFVRDAQAYLCNPGDGLIALLGQCPYESYLVRWSVTNSRFECPACGSKFELDGTYIKGSAARDLSRGTLRVTSDAGTLTTPKNGAPVSIDHSRSIVLDIDEKILGAARPEVGLP